MVSLSFPNSFRICVAGVTKCSAPFLATLTRALGFGMPCTLEEWFERAGDFHQKFTDDAEFNFNVQQSTL